MKFIPQIVTLLLSTSCTNAFTNSLPKAFAIPSSSSFSTQLQVLDSDFASAMPEKPQMSKEEQMIENATAFIVDIENRLGEGVDPVPEVEALRQARDANADPKTIAIKIYELMIEQGMTYDQDPATGSLTPTNFDIKNNLDVPEVKKEFGYLYKYGMNLCLAGVMDVDEVKEIVTARLIERTGLTPEEFDAWLGY